MAGTGRPRPACPAATAPPPSPPQARSRHTWWPLEARGPFLHQQQRPLPPPPPMAEVAPSPPTAAVATATSLTGSCGAFPTDGESDEFLCDVDGMGIEGAVPAVRDAEALHTGQIYFVLPAAARHRGLRREEVAALAVRASAALSPLAASAAAPGLPSLPSPADVGLGPAWPVKKVVLSGPARHGKWPDKPCLGSRLGTVDWGGTARWLIVLYRAVPYRAMLGTGPCQAGPGGPNGYL